MSIWRAITLADRAAGTEGGGRELAVRLHRGLAADGLARAGHRPRRAGFITGPDLVGRNGGPRWPLTRTPFLLETACPACSPRRRAPRLEQAGGLRSARRDVPHSRALLPGDGLMDVNSSAACSSSRGSMTASSARSWWWARSRLEDGQCSGRAPRDRWWVLLSDKSASCRPARRPCTRRDDDDGRPGWGRRLQAWNPQAATYDQTRAAGREHVAPAALGAGRTGALVVPLQRTSSRFLQTVRSMDNAVRRAVADRPRTWPPGSPTSSTTRPRDGAAGGPQETAETLLSALVRLAEHSLLAEQFIAEGLRELAPPTPAIRCSWPTGEGWRLGWLTTTWTTGGHRADAGGRRCRRVAVSKLPRPRRHPRPAGGWPGRPPVVLSEMKESTGAPPGSSARGVLCRSGHRAARRHHRGHRARRHAKHKMPPGSRVGGTPRLRSRPIPAT